MKKLILTFISGSLLLFGCGASETTTETTNNDSTTEASFQKYGDTTITEEGAISMETFLAESAGKDSLQVKLTAEIVECCQKKGCWMTVDMGNDQLMRVTFKDYGFFMPKNSAGMTAIMQGWAKVDTLSVEMQKHYLEDAKASQEEIDAITEPEVEWNFIADGVILKPKG